MNILHITIDQHRWDFVQGGAVPSLKTPAIDGLRAEGVTLTNSFSTCPICMPTRFGWCYGLYASQADKYLLKNAGSWPDHLPSMPQALQRQGYRTALIGKTHSGGTGGLSWDQVEAHTSTRGYDDVVEVSGKSLAAHVDCRWAQHLEKKGLLDEYRSDLQSRGELRGGVLGCERPSFLSPDDSCDGFIRSEAVRWIERYAQDRPFYLHASFCGPHFPIDPPAEYAERYRAEDMPPPAGVTDAGDILAWKRRRALYCGMIEHVDAGIGRVLEALNAAGLTKDTLVIFGSDHGDMMGDHGKSDKCQPYDPSSRIPVILKLPGVLESGKTLIGMVESVDVPCTLLEAAGVTPNPERILPGTPGRSFWSYAKGQTDSHRDTAFSECDVDGDWRMIRTAEWCYVAWGLGRDQLFNMREDPHQLTNVIDVPANRGIRETLTRKLVQSMMFIAAPPKIFREFKY